MSNIEKLLEVMAALRDPGSGCPWDVRQDFSTIAPYTIEEAYEVADAIARDDLDGLRSELGDLLFQVVFHARMAEERKLFDFEAVAGAICDKLIRRHPHVFGSEEERRLGHQPGSWERIKAAERDENTGGASALDGVATTAVDVDSRSVAVSFDDPASFDAIKAAIEEQGYDVPEQA